MSALGSGHACPTTVIASVHQPLYGADSVRRVSLCSISDPVISRCTCLLDSTGLCVQLVKGHPLPGLHWSLAPLGHTRLGLDGSLGLKTQWPRVTQ